MNSTCATSPNARSASDRCRPKRDKPAETTSCQAMSKMRKTALRQWQNVFSVIFLPIISAPLYFYHFCLIPSYILKNLLYYQNFSDTAARFIVFILRCKYIVDTCVNTRTITVKSIPYKHTSCRAS